MNHPLKSLILAALVTGVVWPMVGCRSSKTESPLIGGTERVNDNGTETHDYFSEASLLLLLAVLNAPFRCGHRSESP